MLPTKPLKSSPCNGCGLCCIAEQCTVSLDIFGAAQLCPALEFVEGRFQCGLMVNPGQYGATVQAFRVLPDCEALSAGYYRSLIGAGVGCDSED